MMPAEEWLRRLPPRIAGLSTKRACETLPAPPTADSLARAPRTDNRQSLPDRDPRRRRQLSQQAEPRRKAAESFFHGQFADCGTRLPPQDAATGDPQKPRLFGASLEWKKAIDGFFHGQLEQLPDRFSHGRLRVAGLRIGGPRPPCVDIVAQVAAAHLP